MTERLEGVPRSLTSSRPLVLQLWWWIRLCRSLAPQGPGPRHQLFSFVDTMARLSAYDRSRLASQDWRRYPGRRDLVSNGKTQVAFALGQHVRARTLDPAMA